MPLEDDDEPGSEGDDGPPRAPAPLPECWGADECDEGAPGTPPPCSPPPPLSPRGARVLAGELAEALAQAEQDLCCLSGARELVAAQAERATATGACGVCDRALPDADMADFCATRLLCRRSLAERLEASTRTVAHSSSALRGLRPAGPPPVPSPFRRAYLVRVGALGEWRAQKHECLAAAECVGCGRGFERAGEMERFLQWMDAEARRREELLHRHAGLCG